MKKRIRMFLPLLVLAAMLAAVLPVAVPVVALDGHADAGPGVLIIPDSSGDVGLPKNAPGGTVTGWDMTALHLAYNETADTMYIGIHTNGIIGDADGNGDPGASSAWLTANGGSDLPDLGGSETVAVYFDLDQDGTYDVIAGISGATNYAGFSVNEFTGFFYPPYNFGTALPDNTGDISPNPSVTYPDLEFTVTNWTALPGHDDEPGFCVGAFLGSLQDDGVGEDFFMYCESPCIEITKTVDCNDDGVYLHEDTGSYGDTPSWKIDVHNCGDCYLYNVMVSDTNGESWGPFELAINETWSVNYTGAAIYETTTNNATAIAEDEAGLPVSPVYDSATNVVISPDICIEKTVDCNGDGQFHDEELWYAGDNATWKVVVWNCGDSDLTDVTVTDTNGHNFGAAFNLTVGQNQTLTYNTLVSVNTTNNATVTGTDLLGGTVTDWDIATNNVISPDICIEKTVDCNDDGVYLDEDNGYYGDTPSWFIRVWNCGNSPLYGVNVTDTYGTGWGPFDLDVGESWNVTYDHPGPIYEDTTNNATAVGLDVLGGTVSAWDTATNNAITTDICIEKLVDCNDDGVYLDEDTGYYGDTPSWFVRVWNCGGSPLHGVNVTDTYGTGWGPFDLDVGESWNVTYDHPGPIYEDTTNNATAVGLDVLGGTVTDWDIATNNVISPDICIEKTVDFDNDGVFTDLETYYAGEPADWAINVTNCGDVPVYNITVSDDNNGVDFYGPFDLDPGESEIVPVYTTYPTADFTNEACAEGEDEFGNPVGPVCDTAAVDVISPCLDIEKTVDFDNDGVFTDLETYYAGEPADWAINVTNCGDVPMYNITVSDDNNGTDFYGPFDLNPGESEIVPVYTTYPADDFENEACAEGVDELGNPVGPVCDPAAVDVINPQLCIEKTVDFDGDGIFGDLETGYAGDPANWAINVTNCGDVPVYNITVSDDNNGVDFYGPFDLNPGESEIVPVYTTYPADDFENEACAEGVDELGNPVGPACDPAAVQILSEGICVLIADEDFIDNDGQWVEYWAWQHGVEPDILVNDQGTRPSLCTPDKWVQVPTETDNPWFYWNEHFPGDRALLETGQVEDEGLFCLTNEALDALWQRGGYTLEDFVCGRIPQSKLDKVPGVVPLRDECILNLIGNKCYVIVYDSDISMNYYPLNANLQGARLGLTYLEFLAVENPGSVKESTDDTALLDVWVEVLPMELPESWPLENDCFCTGPTGKPDTVEISRARWSSGTLTVIARTSSRNAELWVYLTDMEDTANLGSVADNYVVWAKMTNVGRGRWTYTGAVPQDVRGWKITVYSTMGGCYNTNM